MPQYEKARVAVDAAIFSIAEGKLKVLLHQREKKPYTGQYELLGGLLLPNETAEETLMRKLKETFGRDDIYFSQFQAFSTPKRDPRVRTLSVAYLALVGWDKVENLEGWQDFDSLPLLAFDHSDIVECAREYLKRNMSNVVVKQFLPEKFPLNSLQEAYEIAEDCSYDNRNFRKRMLALKIVEQTKEKENSVSHRPAQLYTFR